MSTSNRTIFALCAMLTTFAASSDTPNVGQPATPELIQAWDISIAPDGTGLPPGRGGAAEGAIIYERECAACHGKAGVGGPSDALTGGIGSLASQQPRKTVASYWPYATTLFDYIRRAMPVLAPQSLSNDDVYALSAYLLSVDGIVTPDTVLDAESLPKVQMPNRDGFVDAWSRTPSSR